MRVKRKDLLVCTEDHGGYLAGFCAACGKVGWLDTMKHKKDCPAVGEHIYVDIIPVDAGRE